MMFTKEELATMFTKAQIEFLEENGVSLNVEGLEDDWAENGYEEDFANAHGYPILYKVEIVK